MLYVRNDLAATAEPPIIKYSSGVIEIVGVQLKNPNLVIVVIYRQPDDIMGGHRSTSVEFGKAIAELRRVMRNLDTPTPNITLCGDFNLPHATWPTGAPGPGAPPDEWLMLQQLKSLTDEFFLSQYINLPTHGGGNTLDLVFTNNDSLLHSYTSTPTILSDHFMVTCSSSIECQRPDTECDNISKPGNLASLNFFNDAIKWDNI